MQAANKVKALCYTVDVAVSKDHHVSLTCSTTNCTLSSLQDLFPLLSHHCNILNHTMAESTRCNSTVQHV